MFKKQETVPTAYSVQNKDGKVLNLECWKKQEMMSISILIQDKDGKTPSQLVEHEDTELFSYLESQRQFQV